ncbi:uncharacterized protein LOC126810762 [Patella vulgata]|uniref:uncharacterized protein LOC126810762 n=1 Tax=Patella vulgata TaxID=6465 RepID=UPI0021802659|nr:uncharacterized protein LOC126810762 [Patella vulgata]
MEVTRLPAIIITKILAELNWIDKLNAVRAILPWQIYLETTCSWPSLVFKHIKGNWGLSTQENISQMDRFLYCIEKYGKHFKSLTFEIEQSAADWSYWEFQLFEAVLSYCSILQHFKVIQRSNFSWSALLTKTYLEILKKDCLKEAELINPAVPWSDVECNPLLGIINNKLQLKLTVLKLRSDSLDDYKGQLKCLVDFKNLRHLLINRFCITNDTILELTSNSLTELRLYQDVDIPDNHTSRSKEEFWKTIVKKTPEFRIDILMEYVIILKDHFPLYMPLRKLVLDELQTSITKGLLDEIINKYNSTLQSFSCVNSTLSENADGRLELALVDMVRRCKHLQELEYEFSIASSTVLLIAKTRKLKKLRFLRVEVYYDFDDKNHLDYPQDLIMWLKENSKNEEILEKTISNLYGRKWELENKVGWFCYKKNWF